MFYPVHESDTGSFQELIHKTEVKFGQLSILDIEPGCERGGHYHNRKVEWFCCLSGVCCVKIINIDSGCQREVFLTGGHREFIKILPRESHTVVNIGNVDNCDILIIISEPFNPDDPDTFRYQGDK